MSLQKDPPSVLAVKIDGDWVDASVYALRRIAQTYELVPFLDASLPDQIFEGVKREAHTTYYWKYLIGGKS